MSLFDHDEIDASQNEMVYNKDHEEGGTIWKEFMAASVRDRHLCQKDAEMNIEQLAEVNYYICRHSDSHEYGIFDFLISGLL